MDDSDDDNSGVDEDMNMLDDDSDDDNAGVDEDMDDSDDDDNAGVDEDMDILDDEQWADQDSSSDHSDGNPNDPPHDPPDDPPDDPPHDPRDDLPPLDIRRKLPVGWVPQPRPPTPPPPPQTVWAPAVQRGSNGDPGIVHAAELAAAAVRAGTVPEGPPNSRLGLLFGTQGIDTILSRYLIPRDIQNVMNVDAHARRRIIPNLDLNLETRGIIDWDYPLARGGEPEEYMNYVPNPKDNFCDVNEYYERRGPPWQWYFNNHDYLGIPNGVGTPEDHRNERFQRLNIHQHWDIPGYRGEGPPNLQAPPYYDPSQWFKCRQYWHYDNASGHCIVCKEETHEKVHGMPAGEENTEPLYQVVCGFCHTKAIRKFPCGYSPRLISTPLTPWGLINCDCMEAVRYKTCHPCADRILWRTINSDRVTKWTNFQPNNNPHPGNQAPGRYPLRSGGRLSQPGDNVSQWPFCPCGIELNPIKDSDAYPPQMFEDGQGSYNFDAFEVQRVHCPWTVYCKSCDCIWIPRTSIGPATEPPAIPETFKEVLHLPGWRSAPFTNMPPIVNANGDLAWEVTAFRESRIVGGELQYRVAWRGQYNDEIDDTWYPAETFDFGNEDPEMRGNAEMRDVFEAANPDAPTAADIPPPPPPGRGRGRPRRNE